MRISTTILILFAALHARAGDTLRVLFIGNSYVQVNTLPALIAGVATDRGHVLLYTDVSVGGQSLQGHCNSTATLAALKQRGWDYVVLQEQSQMPAFPDAQVARDTYPYAKRLDSLAHIYNPCAKTVFYMTWGRKNGDASNCPGFPLICSYDGMDSLLRSRYTIMAQQNKALIAPVGVAWHKLRDMRPGMDLYQADESHPSLAGSYAAACSFYSVLFRADPVAVRYDAGLAPPDAAAIRQVVKAQVYDSLSRWYAYDVPAAVPHAAFSEVLNGRRVSFTNGSLRASRYSWSFGDGSGDTASAPVHLYAADGSYNVRLVALHCGSSDTEIRRIVIGPAAVRTGPAFRLTIAPNPAGSFVRVQLPDAAGRLALMDLGGREVPIPEHEGAGNVDISLASVPAGVYILELTLHDGSRLRERFIVAH